MMPDTRGANEPRFLFDAGGEAFSVLKFNAVEGISRLFEVDLELALKEEVKADKLLGQPGLLTLEGEDQNRWFHGMICQFAATGAKGSYFLYQVRLVPTVWLAGRKQDCRIFQGKNTPDIVSQVLKGVGLTADMFAFRLQGVYAPREYCVQYRESDLNFIRRLLEEEGIFFFFEHSDSKHMMVFGDSTVNYQPIGGKAQVVFKSANYKVAEEESIYRFQRKQQILSGKFVHTDFNFEKPAMDLKSESIGDSHDDLEIYDSPGDFLNENDGKKLAKIRLEQRRMYLDTVNGRSVCRRLVPGFTFKLTEHEHDAFNAEYLIARISHLGRQPQVLEEVSSTATGYSYMNVFAGVPATTPIRPEQRTPKPVVEGVQTAIVTGPKGEEVYPDKYGRVKVKFHWDRLGQKDEKSSCWIRVSQPWAGSGWGGMFIPRIDQEVIVDFIEGDPDRPIITGRVYHGTNMPPYELPAEKTKSTLKSNSSTGGQGCNEIRFEDKKGEEELFIQAEKDLNIHVKNDRKSHIGQDQHLVTKRDLLEKVERDSHLQVSGNRHRDVGGDDHLKVDGKSASEVAGSFSLKVGGDLIESISGAHSENASGGYRLKTDKAVLEAASNVTLKCGGSSVVLTPGAIYIESSIVNVNSGAGPAGSVASGSLVAPASALAAVAAGSVTAGMTTSQAAAHDAPAHTEPAPGEEGQKTAWVEIQLKDEDGNAVTGEPYRITLPDGKTVARGTTDDKGVARVSGFVPGNCKVTLPNRDRDAWGK